MNTLQQVIKQRSDEFEKWLGDGAEKDKDGLTWTRGRFALEELSSHNQETVEAILEAMKEWGNKVGLPTQYKTSLDDFLSLQDIKKQNHE